MILHRNDDTLARDPQYRVLSQVSFLHPTDWNALSELQKQSNEVLILPQNLKKVTVLLTSKIFKCDELAIALLEI
jgi:hypothetical protein